MQSNPPALGERKVRLLEAEIAQRTKDLGSARTELEQASARLRELSLRIIDGQEQERHHIARELHDEIGQALTVIGIHLAELAQHGDPEGARVAACMEVVNRATAHIRGIALNLRPPMLDDLRLADAIEWALAQQTAAVGWQGVFEGSGADRRFPFDVEIACFRIAQEAITNAARYSQARELKVTLRQVASGLELTVTETDGGSTWSSCSRRRSGRSISGCCRCSTVPILRAVVWMWIRHRGAARASMRCSRFARQGTSKARLLHPSCPPHARTLATWRLADRGCALIDDRSRKATPGLRAPAAGGTDLKRGARDEHRRIPEAGHGRRR